VSAPTSARPTVADSVIQELALELHDAEQTICDKDEAIRQLVALVADVSFDNSVLRTVADQYFRESAQRGKTLRRRNGGA
jgi:hypothetical protein